MLTALARAKVNLCLSVTGKREDGLHVLESLCVFPPAGDRITISTPQDHDVVNDCGISLRLTGPYATALEGLRTEDNLVMRAARELHEIAVSRSGKTAAPERAIIGLEKNLPPASGIGGGTSDAMTALFLLNDLWDLTIDRHQLMRMAFRLGADGPACLLPHLERWFAKKQPEAFSRHAARARPVAPARHVAPGWPQESGTYPKPDIAEQERPAGTCARLVPTVFVSGAGEEVAAGPRLPAFAMLMVNPGVFVATADVFRRHAAQASHNDHGPRSRWTDLPAEDIESFTDLIDCLSRCKNDLEEAASFFAPEITRVIAMLAAQPDCALARMSGSGATCFGIFRTLDAATRAADAFRQSGNPWAVPCDLGTSGEVW